jgi:UTP-glucose-1-phosphate uridylyltransferase
MVYNSKFKIEHAKKRTGLTGAEPSHRTLLDPLGQFALAHGHLEFSILNIQLTMSPALVILAAGLGSRYGGLKQMEPLGPGGQTILDYSIFDARRAGFGAIVFIIRREFADAFKERVGARVGGEVRYAFQEMADLPGGFTPPAGRAKPWGTGHAVWCARNAVHEPFAVINADDFYGADAFRQLASFLKSTDARGTDFAMAGYRLGQTLSENGAVARGICETDAAGFLTKVTEQTGLERNAAGGAIAKTADGYAVHFAADTLVSMNCWAFTSALFPLLGTQLEKFLRTRGTDAKAEFYLPAAVGALINNQQARVRMLPTTAQWFGLTHPADRPIVQEALRALHAQGDYPASF